MTTINDLRKQIDDLDDIIIDALEKRFALTNKVGLLKKTNHTSVYQGDREAFIFDKMKQHTYYVYIAAVYKSILAQSKSQQKG